LRGRLKLPAGASPELIEVLRTFGRQALHATRLRFTHPVTGDPVDVEQPPPADFATLLIVLRRDAERVV
ncbi:MAG: RNA pseudouridine synthase, partial [Gammaproteobacteria bacterium]|nr:RNA pseudouridine synthase [Gammaproteobacteria bacterium]